MKTKSKEPIVPVNDWYCENCDGKKVMNHIEMMEHLRAVHQLEPKGLKCRKEMLMHLDAADSYSSTWKVTVKKPDDSEIILTNATMNPRHKHDPMREPYTT